MKLIDKHRPKTLDKLSGLENIKLYFNNTNLDSHSYIFCGNPGVGKTSVARILSDRLNAELFEINAADSTGIDNVRELIDVVDKSTFGGNPRLFIIDEAQKLSNSAQNAFLKPVEDGFKRDFIIFCTTDPKKILKTLRDRCTFFTFPDQTKQELIKKLKEIFESEKFIGDCTLDISNETFEQIADISNGSSRVAINSLDNFIKIGKISTIESYYEDTTPEILDLYMAMWGRNNTLEDCFNSLSKIPQEPETIRIHLANMFSRTLVSKRNIKSIDALKILFQWDGLYGPDAKYRLIYIVATIKSKLSKRGGEGRDG